MKDISLIFYPSSFILILRMNSYFKYFCMVAIFWTLGNFGFLQTTVALDVEVGVEVVGIKKIKIAVAPMISSPNSQVSVEGLSDNLTQILRNDLEISGFFDTLKDKTFLITQLHQSELGNESINFNEWAVKTEVQALIKCIYTLQQESIASTASTSTGQTPIPPKGQFSLECRVYDIPKASEVLGKRYDTDPKQVRKAIHRFADEVILKFTGERGVSDTSLVFVSNRSKNKELYRIDFDGENLQRLTSDGSILLSPSWSPDGNQILYTSYRDNNPDLFLISANGGEPKPISIQPGLNLGGKWSPDGKQIALSLSKDGNSEIYLLDILTRTYRRLTKNRWSDVSPSWSPDGDQIAFTSDMSGTPQVYIMKSNGANVRRLSFIGNYSTSPAWSPRGDRIAFAAMKGGKFDIYTIGVDGRGIRQLTSNRGSNEDPTWSRDGRYIAFHSTRDGNSSIYIMNQDGTNLRRVTDSKGNDTSPAWSP